MSEVIQKIDELIKLSHEKIDTLRQLRLAITIKEVFPEHYKKNAFYIAYQKEYKKRMMDSMFRNGLYPVRGVMTWKKEDDGVIIIKLDKQPTLPYGKENYKILPRFELPENNFKNIIRFS